MTIEKEDEWWLWPPKRIQQEINWYTKEMLETDFLSQDELDRYKKMRDFMKLHHKQPEKTDEEIFAAKFPKILRISVDRDSVDIVRDIEEQLHVTTDDNLDFVNEVCQAFYQISLECIVYSDGAVTLNSLNGQNFDRVIKLN